MPWVFSNGHESVSRGSESASRGRESAFYFVPFHNVSSYCYIRLLLPWILIKMFFYFCFCLTGWVTCSGPITENWPSRRVWILSLLLWKLCTRSVLPFLYLSQCGRLPTFYTREFRHDNVTHPGILSFSLKIPKMCSENHWMWVPVPGTWYKYLYVGDAKKFLSIT